MRIDLSRKKIWLYFCIVGVLLIALMFLPFNSKSVALPYNEYTREGCTQNLVATYGGTCQPCKVRCGNTNLALKQSGQTYVLNSLGQRVDISMCEIGGGYGNSVDYFGSASYCSASTNLVHDGSCTRNNVNVRDQCSSGNYHLDYNCASGARCGSGADVRRPVVTSDPVCSSGGELSLSDDNPSTIYVGESYTIKGKFTASCNGDYYLEAYQSKESYKPYSVLTSSKGACDDNIGTAGRYVTLSRGESVDLSFTLKDYGRSGTYDVVLGAYNGCSNQLLGDFKIYDTKSMSLSVKSGSSGDGDTSADNNSDKNAFDFSFSSAAKWVGIIAGGLFVVLLIIIIIGRKRK